MNSSQRLLIALDIDGTLIQSDQSYSQRVVDAVKGAQNKGHIVMLATGRSWDMAHAFHQAFDLKSEFVVCANGAVIMKKNPAQEGEYEIFHAETFDPEPVLDALLSHLPEGIYMTETPDGFRQFTGEDIAWDVVNGRQVSFEELRTRPVTRIVVVSHQHNEAAFSDIVESIGLSQVTYSVGAISWLDIAPQGVNKATALERVRTLLNVEKCDLAAMGDGQNDVEMFAWAGEFGRAFAMGQAFDEVKKFANEVTASVEEDGVAVALEKLLG